jgi:hypothetical protein
MSVATLQLGRPMDAPTARVIAHPAMSYSDTLASGSLTTATYAERAHGYEPIGYALANAGHDTRALQAWLGHKNIQHTVRYTELAPDRFKNFWR